MSALFKKKYLFIYLFRLHRVLVAARRIFVAACRLIVAACGLLVAACMWGLVPQPGIEPGSPALGVRSLTHWAAREVPLSGFKVVRNRETHIGGEMIHKLN